MSFLKSNSVSEMGKLNIQAITHFLMGRNPEKNKILYVEMMTHSPATEKTTNKCLDILKHILNYYNI